MLMLSSPCVHENEHVQSTKFAMEYDGMMEYDGSVIGQNHCISLGHKSRSSHMETEGQSLGNFFVFIKAKHLADIDRL